MLERPIILQGAMEIEIDYFKETIENLEEIEIHGYKFYKGIYNKYPIIVSKTNIGIVEATLSTYIAITNFNPIAIINQGTAGGYVSDIHKYDIIIGKQAANINSYITNNKKEKEGSSPLEWNLLTFKEGVAKEFVKVPSNEKLYNVSVECQNKYKVGNVISGIIGSGDNWNNEIDRIKWFNEKYDILCEDMETASVYEVCNKLNIPVIGLRVISNNAVTQEEFDKKTALELQKYILEVCKKIIIQIKGE